MNENSCKYFRSPVHHTSCKLNINYRDLAGEPQVSYLARLPCSNSMKLKDPVSCESKVKYTADEMKAIEKELTERAENFSKAISAIKKLKNNPQHGDIECPKCKKRLYFSIAKSNGHIWGKCESEKCLSWMM